LRTKEDFIFTIGYDGPAAVIDGQAKKLYSKLTAGELAEKGFFRAACSASVWSNDPAEIQNVADIYNKTAMSSGSQGSPVTPEALQRLFGVFMADVKRSIVL